jgi:hypothetical protein
MENVWAYVRPNKLCRLVWGSYEVIVAACKDGWDFLIDGPQHITSIGTGSWACAND